MIQKIEEIKIQKSLGDSNRTNIKWAFFESFQKRYWIKELYKTSKSVHGKIINNDRKAFFFKILTRARCEREMENYLLIKSVYPVPRLKYRIILKDKCILVYNFERSVEKNGGIFFDYLNKDKLNTKKFSNLLDLYLNSFKKSNTFRRKYPLKVFFSERINSRLKKVVLKDKRIKQILDYKMIINGECYTYSTRELIDQTIKYFRRNSLELCFLSQGDPEPTNLGTKPLLFDFESSGINPLLAEFAIFFWGVFMEEAYYAQKYNRGYYASRKGLKSELKGNKPKTIIKISRKYRTLDLGLNYNLSNARKKMLLMYIGNFIEVAKIKNRHKFMGRLRYFILMRILTTLDLNRYSKEDVYSSIGFVHIFCNYIIAKNLNTKYELPLAIGNKI